jgi:hypothetical protein
MQDITFFRYGPDPSPVETFDWSKVTVVVIDGKHYPVEYVEKSRDEIRFQFPGANDVVDVVS